MRGEGRENDSFAIPFQNFGIVMFNADKLKILPPQYLPDFRAGLPSDLEEKFHRIPTVEFTTDVFGFYTSIASVFSSKIEGENIELDSYLKHRFQQVEYLPDYTRKTDDLFDAYEFARTHPLTMENAPEAHAILTKHILTAKNRGRVRTNIEMILDREGRIEYVAAPPDIVKQETEKLFHDIELLLKSDLDLTEAFYFAGLVHLVFLKIHPMADGNGRSARLLEKWFLAQALGENAWQVPSERYYYEHLTDYYRNVHIGLEYESVQYERCLPMLMMLVEAVTNSVRK